MGRKAAIGEVPVLKDEIRELIVSRLPTRLIRDAAGCCFLQSNTGSASP